MPKISIGDINIYYRVFRNHIEYQTTNETEQASFYLSEKNEKVSVTKPLKLVDGIKIEKGRLESDLPTLIMLPGGPGFVDHSIYLDFWAKLSHLIQVVVLDQRGNGRSDRGDPELWNMDTCAQDITLFCKALNIKKPLVAGVSWGGYVAIRYATQFPDHLAGLILMHTEAKVNTIARQEAFAERAQALGCTQEQITEVRAAVRAYDETPTLPGVRENYMEKCWGKFYAKNPYQPADFAACVTNMPMREKFATEENLYFDYRAELYKIHCPVWFVAAKLDPGHPYQGAQEAAKLIQNVRLDILEDMGAPVYREDFSKIMALTEDVFKQLFSKVIGLSES